MIIRGVRHERGHVVKPFPLRLILLSHRLFPGPTMRSCQ